MGFFSELLGTVTTIGGALLGIPVTPVAAAQAAAQPMTALAAIPAQPAPTPLLAGTGLATGRVSPPGAFAVSQTTARALFTAAGSPTGGLRKRTIVETFDPGSGFITRRKVHDGGVAVFASDVAAARRINRQVRKLDARLPRKLVKQSVTKQLTDRVVNNALRHAGDPHNNGSP